jgi:hypothetical protein
MYGLCIYRQHRDTAGWLAGRLATAYFSYLILGFLVGKRNT